MVTQTLLGRPASRPSGFSAIAGITFLKNHSDLNPPAALEQGLGLAVGPKGVGMFLALHRPRTKDIVPESIQEVAYLVWPVIAQDPAFSANITEMGKELLIEESQRMIGPWASFYKTMIERTERNTLAAINFVYPGAMIPWPKSRLTLIGDAVHPMPPTAGAGASTAIIDALNLVDLLRSESWSEALEQYRDRMLGYAPIAVNLSRPALVWQVRFGNTVLRRVALSIGLPLVGMVVRVLRRK